MLDRQAVKDRGDADPDLRVSVWIADGGAFAIPIRELTHAL